MRVKLNVWRQAGPTAAGKFVSYDADISEDMSFLEVLDVINDRLEAEGQEAIAFDHDCREGICGMCGFMVNGVAHGHKERTTVCQLHMREFKEGDEITIEPWRAKAFEVVKDLIVDRSAFDRIIQSGGYISSRAGSAPDANSIPIGKEQADLSFDAAACIGCGACVAACPNGAAMLFTGAKMFHLNNLPQGKPEQYERAVNMVTQMDAEDFGHCTNFGECSVVCPKGISLDVISRMNRDFLVAQLKQRKVD